ncbi:PREDICTED: protein STRICTOSIDINE SYNTHASE-LIKE 1-like [Tarenaya hassleriana]|uniref:protein STRICTOSIDINE SYNTHASE-LIKE 1-like n=1 Tax=Tarenaya hassleriana TaxID=28532 RepID=UPI00053C2E22|nr:PREDICTED: protein STRICTOSIDINE SYNTHASE-LIKE 1-like [Tarenaya hassleriana]
MPISRRLLAVAGVPVAVAIFVVIAAPYIIAPPRIEGAKDVLHRAKPIPVPGEGPESLDWDPQGEGPYVGVADGRILKWRGEVLGWSEFAVTSPNRENCSKHVPELEHICGRPLGVHFEKKSGDLYICDCYFGVMKVGPGGGLAEKVVDEAAGRKVTFTNHMDIDEEEDAIYFTDSSDKYQIRTVFNAFMSGEKTGRVIRYDKKTKEAKVIMENLHFPNGLALSKDGSFVVVCEPPSLLVHRYWLKGPKAGSRDVFAKLPGYSDNIRRTADGDFWVAIHSKKGVFPQFALIHPWIGKFLMKTMKMELMVYLFEGGKPHAVAVKLSEKGEIMEILEDSQGKTMTFVSEVQERDGKLWFGSVFMPFVWVYDLN